MGKRFWYIFFFTFLLLIGGRTLAHKKQEKPISPPIRPRIVAFSFEKVAKSSKEIQKVEKWLEKMKGSLEKEIHKYKVEISKLSLKMKKLNPQSAAYQDLQWKTRSKALEMKNYVHYFTQKLQKEYERRLALGLEKIRKEIQSYCKKKKYGIVLDVSSQKEGIFYVDPRFDITQELKRLVQK